MAALPWKPIVLAVLALAFLAVVLTPDPSARTLSNYTNDELIAALSTSRAAVHRAACGQLIARGKTVVPTLLAALPDADEQQRRGLFEVLEELMLSNDADVADSAESALERLRHDDDRAVADDAERVLNFNAVLRHGRALAQLVGLGARLETVHPSDHRRATGRADLFSMFSYPETVPLVVLDSGWTGGDPGLKYLGRIFPAEMLTVHVSSDAAVTAEALRRARSSRPWLMIRREHEGCLGVIVDSSSVLGQVMVAGVVRESPAERAGIQAGDIILDFEGRRIHQYEDLTRNAVNRPPGEFVHLTLQRDDATIRLRLALGSDFLTTRCHCVEDTVAVPQ